MVKLPDILTEPEYENTWEWDGWKPKAKSDAPEEVKKAIKEFLHEVEEPEPEDGSDSFIYL